MPRFRPRWPAKRAAVSRWWRMKCNDWRSAPRTPPSRSRCWCAPSRRIPTRRSSPWSAAPPMWSAAHCWRRTPARRSRRSSRCPIRSRAWCRTSRPARGSKPPRPGTFRKTCRWCAKYRRRPPKARRRHPRRSPNWRRCRRNCASPAASALEAHGDSGMTDISSQTLHIVAKELAATLNDARASLEAYAERSDQRALLEKCADQLHSAHGVLRLVEVYGAALLAEEMEHVTRYLLSSDNDQKRHVDGLDALMRAMVQLPTYLERVLSGGRDLALVLLPLLNDLRSVRGSPLLSEGTLLLLNLKSDQPAQPQSPRQDELSISVAQWARRLRPRFQIGLLGYIRGERTVQNLEILAKVAEKLEQVATTQPVFQLWWVVGALLEAVRANGIEGSATLKRLLGQADRQIKMLYELGEARYCEDPPVDLLNNLLYYVARASTSDGRIGAVRASFKLSELLPVDDSIEQERESLSAPSVKLMRTVAAAIKEDLSKVKDVLDIFVRRGGGHSDELLPQLELLKKISDTLGVLGLGELRQRVQEEISELSDIVSDGKAPSELALIKVAGVLLSVEDSLDDQLVRLILPAASLAADIPVDQDHEFRQVSEAVLRECIVNLARIKEAVSLSVQKPTEFAPQGLDNVPQLLRGITAGLLMLGKG